MRKGSGGGEGEEGREGGGEGREWERRGHPTAPMVCGSVNSLSICVQKFSIIGSLGPALVRAVTVTLYLLADFRPCRVMDGISDVREKVLFPLLYITCVGQNT